MCREPARDDVTVGVARYRRIERLSTAADANKLITHNLRSPRCQRPCRLPEYQSKVGCQDDAANMNETLTPGGHRAPVFAFRADYLEGESKCRRRKWRRTNCQPDGNTTVGLRTAIKIRGDARPKSYGSAEAGGDHARPVTGAEQTLVKADRLYHAVR